MTLPFRAFLLLSLLIAPSACLTFADEPSPLDPQATPPPPASQRRPAGIPIYYLTIAKELALEGEQRQAFLDKVRARQQALAQFDAAHEQEIQTLTDQETQAQQRNDTAALRQIRARLRELRAQRSAIEQQALAQIRSVLTPQQRGRWLCYNSYLGQLQRFGKLDLSDQQKADIKALCLSFADRMADLDPADTSALRTIRQEMTQKIIAQILTDQQRQQLTGSDSPSSTPSPQPHAQDQPAMP